MVVSGEIDAGRGDALKIRRRTCLANDWDMILSQNGLFSHGDSLLVLSPQSLNRPLCQELVAKYQRVMFLGDGVLRTQLKKDLARGGYFISEDYALIEGAAARVIPLCQEAIGQAVTPGTLQRKILMGPDTIEIADRLERMQAACGLDSLPASFLADRRLSRTVYLVAADGEIAAVSTVADLSSAGGEWKGAAMVLRTGVATPYRRQGLGTYIKAHALLQAHADFGCERFIGIIGGDNPGSFRMNGAVGLHFNERIGLLGVENRH